MTLSLPCLPLNVTPFPPVPTEATPGIDILPLDDGSKMGSCFAGKARFGPRRWDLEVGSQFVTITTRIPSVLYPVLPKGFGKKGRGGIPFLGTKPKHRDNDLDSLTTGSETFVSSLSHSRVTGDGVCFLFLFLSLFFWF